MKTTATFYFRPAEEYERCSIGDRDLHCGDCFRIYVNGTWQETRIELCHESGWYLVGLNPSDARHYHQHAATID